jgi:dihydroorotate dehydrogenase
MIRYKLLKPLFGALEPERAHGLVIRALKLGFLPPRKPVGNGMLAVRLWNREFANPIGLAAGFDKQAEVIHPMLGQGFGFVEIGTVTPRPQPGNPKPRLFRLTEDEGVINRLGFNSAGMEAVARNLAAYRTRPDRRAGPVGVNLGKNKESTDAAADYVAAAKRLAGYADYLVLNVSSPNTPGLRALQDKSELAHILVRVKAALAQGGEESRLPLLVKIAPDLTETDLADIADMALAGLADGLIVSNTTVARPSDLKSRWKSEPGGLSGKPLFASSTRVLAEMYRLTHGHVPLIGVGGIGSPEDAYDKIRAGASLVQLYSALVYHGPELVTVLQAGLAALLRRDGFANVPDAVGVDHR